MPSPRTPVACIWVCSLVQACGAADPEAASLRTSRAKHADAPAVEAVTGEPGSELAPFDSKWLEAQEALRVVMGIETEPDDVGHASWKAWNAAALITWIIWLSLTLLVYGVCYPERRRPERVRGSNADPLQVMTDGHFQCLHDHKVFLWACCCPSLRWADTVSMGGFASFWTAFITFSVLSLLNYMNFYLAALVVLLTAMGFVYAYAKHIEGSAPEHLDKQESNDVLKWTIVLIGVLLLVVAMVSLGYLLYTMLWTSAASIYMGFLGCFTWGAFTTSIMVVHRQGLRRMFSMPYGNFSTLSSDWCFIFWCPWCAIAQEARAVSDAYMSGHSSVRGGPAPEVLPSYGT